MIGEILLSGNIIPGIYICKRLMYQIEGLCHSVKLSMSSLMFKEHQIIDYAFLIPFLLSMLVKTPNCHQLLFRGFNFANNLLNVDGELSYSTIVDNASMFLINGGNGDVSIHQPLDYESTVDIYTIIIDVEDDSGTHALASLSVHVTNFNDERPSIF